MDRRGLIVLLAAFAACEAVPRHEVVAAGVDAFLEEIDDEDLTEAEAWRLLGNPFMRFGNTHCFLVGFETREGAAVRVPLTWEDVQQRKKRGYSLVLVFDARTGKLQRHSLVPLYGSGPVGHARAPQPGPK